MHVVLIVIRDHWKLGLFVLLFLPILIRLGVWQLDRAAEKHALLTVYQQQQDLPAIPFKELLNISAEEKRYRNISIDGYYDQERYWLLDNRTRDGVAGYEIITPLQSRMGTILINRGWMAAPVNRQLIPDVNTPSGKVSVKGYLYDGEKNALVQHSLSDLDLDWPKRVLQLDSAAAEAALGQSIYPMMLRIDTDNPSALITRWPIINTQPEKHQGYALQWFAMAAALVVLYGWFLIKGYEKNE